MKLCITDHIPIFIFSVFELGKRKRKLDYPIPYFHYGIEEQKNEQTVYTTHGAFPFSYFHLAKERTKIIWRIIFLISVFCLRIRKAEEMLSNSFSILYYEIEKRNTKGLYIYGSICLLYIAGLRWGIVCVWHTITMVDKLIFLLVLHINSSIFLLIYSFICSFLYFWLSFWLWEMSSLF